MVGGRKMKTLEELVKELGLKPNKTEKREGRRGDYVHIFNDNTYITFEEDLSCIYPKYIKQIIEVKPEWNTI